MERPFSSYRGDEPYIFVSYSHADTELVYPEIHRLQNRQINIWYDEGISPGAKWRDEIAEAILNCDLFLIFLSGNSISSKHCGRELNFAEEHGRRILVVYLEEVSMPPGLEMTLAERQAILKYLISEKEYENKLLTGIQGQVADESLVTQTMKKPRRLVPVILITLALLVTASAAYFLGSGQPGKDSDSKLLTTDTRPAIAVLPFADLSQEQNQAWFSDGIAEEVLNGLAMKPQLKVIARTSSFLFRDSKVDIQTIGSRLKATHLLEGSVRAVGDHIRVSTKLIETSTGTQIWSNQFDTRLTDVFAVQDSISKQILTALDIHLAPVTDYDTDIKQINPDAYRAYLRGKHFLSQLHLDEATRYLEQAARLDPTFADPLGVLARTQNIRVFLNQVSVNDVIHEIDRLVEVALRLDPEQREALATRASNLFYVSREYQASILEFDRLIRKYPNDSTVVSLYRNVMPPTNQKISGRRLADRMTAMDPLSPQAHIYRGGFLTAIGEFREANESFVLAIQLGSMVPGLALYNAILLKDHGLFETHQAQYLVERSRDADYLISAALDAYVHHNKEDAELFLQELEASGAYITHSSRATVAFIRDDRDGIFSSFRAALAASDYQATHDIHSLSRLKWIEPSITEDPRYLALVREAGLDTDSLAKLQFPELPF